MKILGKPTGKLDVKRLYLGGVVIKGQCPKCQTEKIIDFSGSDYLYYPEVNEPFSYPLYCADCDHSWDVNIKLTVLLDIVGDKNNEPKE